MIYKLLLNITNKKTTQKSGSLFGCSNNLSSRTVASQVLSALVSLTTVFGMRTGGTSPLTSPQWYIYKVSLEHIAFSRALIVAHFLLSRQIFYTADSQLHRFFSFLKH